MRRRTKVLLTAAVAVPLVIGGTSTAYAAHFQSRALPGSTVSGVSVAGLDRGEVARVVRERADDVTVTVTNGDTTQRSHLADLGTSVDVDATVDAVFAANRSWSAYATSLVSPRDVEAVVATDPAATAQVLAGLVGDEGRATDARVALAKDKASFAVTPAVPGRTVLPDSFQDVVADAARDLASATATVRFDRTDPAVSTEAAQEVADRANALVRRTVAVSDGEEEHAASAKVKASWVTIPTAAGVPGTPTVDAAKVTAWVTKQAEAARVEARTGLRYLDAAGDVRLVRTQARDGRTVKNAADVVRAVVAGKDVSGRFQYTTQQATWDEKRIAAGAELLAYPAADGEKWIDVDLGAHTITAYVGAKKVYGPVKMVNGSDEKPTAVGTFAVYLKYTQQTMRGSNADGTRYETPDVPWVSYWHRGFAFHGAPWRSSFGYAGDRGSHGCINLPVPVAKWVYDFATVGTVVTSHH